MADQNPDNTNTATPSVAPREAHQRAGTQTPNPSIFGTPIHTYTRAQALADGELIDVTQPGKEAGFRCPVAITRAVWSDCVEWSDQDTDRQTYQDEAGRLWDVIWMAHLAARRGGSETLFQLRRVPRGGRGRMPRLVTLKMIAGPGDAGELTITIMMKNED